MHPYGETRSDLAPTSDDDRDQRAARRTVRLLALALFVAVVAGTLVLTLLALDEDSSPTSDREDGAGTVATTPPVMEIGPAPGVEVAGYVSGRKAALAGLRDERVAVVSLANYSTQAQARALVGSLPVEALLVAPRGVGPSVVTGDLSAWLKAQTEATRAERDEIKNLAPTVDDPAFKAFYAEEVDRLEKALKSFVPDSPMVFGLVVRGPAAALQALGARPEVRLVDVGEPAVAGPQVVYRGLRPEEQVRANDPSFRPL